MCHVYKREYFKCFFLCTESSKGGVLIAIHAQNLVNLHVMFIEEKTSNNCSVYKVSRKS